ncbi:MAG TPA: hypothetical protein VN257_10875 [Actinotalea sp.]|nr:hypothetical protein [Actinotalea sp.]
MRWDDLFADMEHQLDAAAVQDRADQVAELTRTERASVTLVDRLRAQAGSPLVLELRGGERLRGAVADVAASWLLLVDDRREHLVPVRAVAAVEGLVAASVPPTLLARRLGLGHALRAVARDRAVVRVVAGSTVLVGRVDGVGADHLDVALVHTDSGRPTGQVRVVPFDALERVTSA